MLRFELIAKKVAAFAVVIAAGALTGCAGEVGVTDAPERSVRAEMRKVSGATADRADDEKSAKGEAAERVAKNDADSDEGTSEAGRDAAAQLTSVEQAKAVDLEFSAGLPEPSQEQVVPAPAPWTPAPEVDAGPKPVIEDVWPTKVPAAGGDRVVLRGKNLQAAQVVFGTTPAKIIEASDDKLTVAAPEAGAGEVAIVVTNRDGNYAVAGAPFQYYN